MSSSIVFDEQRSWPHLDFDPDVACYSLRVFIQEERKRLEAYGARPRCHLLSYQRWDQRLRYLADLHDYLTDMRYLPIWRDIEQRIHSYLSAEPNLQAVQIKLPLTLHGEKTLFIDLTPHP